MLIHVQMYKSFSTIKESKAKKEVKHCVPPLSYYRIMILLFFALVLTSSRLNLRSAMIK